VDRPLVHKPSPLAKLLRAKKEPFLCTIADQLNYWFR